MKRSLVLIVAVLVGCTRGQTCTFPSGGGTAKIAAECLDGTLLGVDGDALIAYQLFNVPGPGTSAFRLDTRVGTRTTLTSDVYARPRPIVANGELYFLACDNTPTSATCRFQAVPTAGGPARTIVELSPEQAPGGLINGFAVDDASIYWIGSAVWSAPLAGGTGTQLADAHGDEKLVAVDATGLYAASTVCPGAFEKISLDGSTRTPIINESIGSVAARDGVVYWMEPTSPPENGGCSSGGGGSGGGCGGPEFGSLRSWSADAGVQTVQTSIDGFGALVLDRSLVWTVGAVGPHCQSPNLNGIVQLVDGAPMTLVTSGDEGLFGSLVTDGLNLYGITPASIWRVPFR